MRVLYAGDGPATGAARYLIGVMKYSGIDYTHFSPYHLSGIPSNPAKLSKYDVIILSDAPANKLSKRRMRALERCVKEGMGLGMIGGWDSFTGFDGNYSGTLVEKILPVLCINEDDRINCSDGLKPIKVKDHPILKDLPWQHAPTVCGYNRVLDVKDSETVLAIKPIESFGRDRVESLKLGSFDDPLLVVRDYYEGRTLAFTTDIGPHWCGGLVDWGKNRIRIGGAEFGYYYKQFLTQMLGWLAKV